MVAYVQVAHHPQRQSLFGSRGQQLIKESGATRYAALCCWVQRGVGQQPQPPPTAAAGSHRLGRAVNHSGLEQSSPVQW